MNAFFVAARTVHYASTLTLFGELVLVLAMAMPAWRDARHPGAGNGVAIDGRLSPVARWCVVASLASGVAWLAAEAAVMSGLPIEQAISPDVLGLVLGKTTFGRVWMLRFGLVIAAWALLLAMGRSPTEPRRLILAIGAAGVAGAYLAALAWAGHAAAGQGSDGDVEIVADVVHLLAAGAWLGALPGFVLMLARPQAPHMAAQAARRFSTLGVLCVSALTLSGLASAWYRVGDVPALIGTDYGRLLLAKLALFAAMLAIALVNRGSLTTRLAGRDRIALSSFRRNVLLEIAAGIGVVSIVGVLGDTIPAAHQSPLWPFARTLSMLPLEQSAWMQVVVAALGAGACIAAGVALKGALGRPPRVETTMLAGIAAAVGIVAWLLAVPAHPTTYWTSPVGYTVDSIANGAARYAENCRTCHGRDGHGDGLARGSSSGKPVKLTERVPNRREGDLFWWIAHGIPDTPMPGFAPRISDAEIWDLIGFLDAQAAAREALAMTDRAQPLAPIVAPEFTFEFSGRPQESLLQLRGNHVALLVLYTLPQSLPRLSELAIKERAYAAAGARVIVVPFVPSSIATDAGILGNGSSIVASASPNVATVYAMFARQPAGPVDDVPAHVEFLIDRQGYLRVRWIGIAGTAAERMAATLDRIDILNHEPPRRPAPWGHAHR
jgi:putative copper export protein/mono/diheme cytochrome c family protein